MAEREVIREFLASLGFSVDEPSFRKFSARLATSRLAALRTGASILGIATATEVAVTSFARGMEKMYYISKRTGATVSNMSAMEFGFGQIGLTADDARGSIEAMTAAIRNNPGLGALLKKFVGDETDPVKQWRLLMKELKKMPYFVGAQFAEMFGTPENVFRSATLPGALEAMDAAMAKQKEMYSRMGVDQEQAAEASKNFMNTLRELWAQVGVLGDAFLIKLLPGMQSFNSTVGKILEEVIKLDEITLGNLAGVVYENAGRWDGLARSIAGASKAVADFTLGKEQASRMLEADGKLWAWILGGANWQQGGRREPLFKNPDGPGDMKKPSPQQQPGALLDWPGRPLDYDTELRREQERQRRMSGNTSPRAGADADALRAMQVPGAVTVNQETNIHVSGSEPGATGRAVAGEQRRVNREYADVVRNSLRAVR